MPPPPTSREKILEVAEALFARRGYAGVGLREVALAAGLGKSSLFHHFRSKAQLYCEVLERVLLRMRERLAPAAQAPSAPALRLERWIDALISGLAEQPNTSRLLLRALFEEDEFEPPPELLRAERTLAEILGGIERILRDGVEQGVFRAVSVPHTVQSLIGASVYHFASAEVGETILGGPLFSAEAVARRRTELIALFHHGLAAGAPAADGPSLQEV